MSDPDDSEKAIEAIRAEPALAQVPMDGLRRLVDQGTLQPFAEGDTLLAQGNASDHAFILVEGEVRVVADDIHGPVVVAVLRAPCLIGEIAALAGLSRTATVIAGAGVKALRIERPILLQLAQETPEITLRVIGQLGNRIRQFNKTVGLYTHALSALESNRFDATLLDELRQPVPDLVEFGQTLARFAEQIVLRRQREDEMASAAAIQRALLPTHEAIIAIDNADLWAMMVPAKEVGGDFFDVIELADGRVAIGIGDVCGKGMPAALFMGIAKTLLRISIKTEPDLAVAISRANSFLVNENNTELFATLFYAVFDPVTRSLDYCSCGHNPPFVRRANGSVMQLAGGGMPVGIFDTAKFKIAREYLASGDVLLLYTDGVTEAVDTAGVEFGEARLASLLRDGPRLKARAWSELVHQSVARFADGAPQGDDITTLVMVVANETLPVEMLSN